MGDTTSSRRYLSYRMIKTGTTEGGIRRLTVPQVTVYRCAEPVRLTEHRTADCSAIIGAAARQAPDEARHPSGATKYAQAAAKPPCVRGRGRQSMRRPPIGFRAGDMSRLSFPTPAVGRETLCWPLCASLSLTQPNGSRRRG
jgi:hypothetical protein